MKQQNSEQRSFSSDTFQHKVRSSREKLKFNVSRKMNQLQNKAYFFEGQLNPVSQENKKLKDSILNLSKSVSFSTDTLRNLLPVESNPSRKLKLQMASIQEISQMIKQDWFHKLQQINHLRKENQKKQQRLKEKQEIFVKTIMQLKNQKQTIIKEFVEKIEAKETALVNLKNQIQRNIQIAAKQKEEIKKEMEVLVVERQKIKKEYKILCHEVRQKEAGYEKAILRLKEEIQTSIIQFEEGKKNIKEIYSKMMEEKLEEQKQGYEMMIKTQEEDKINLMMKMEEQAQFFQKKMSQKDIQIKYMSGVNDQLKVEVGNCKDDIWKQKLKIDDYVKSIKEIGLQLRQQEESNKILKKKMNDKEEYYEQQKQKWKNKEENLIKENLDRDKEIESQKLKMKEEKEKYEQNLLSKEEKVNSLKRKIRENDEKFEGKLRQEKKKYQQIIEQEKEEKENFKHSLLIEKEKVFQKTKEFEEKQNIYRLQIAEINQKFEEEAKNLQKECQNKLIRLRTEQSNQISVLKRDYERNISQIQIANNEYVRKLVLDQNKKILEHENKFKEFSQKSEEKMKACQAQVQRHAAESMRLKQNYDGAMFKLQKNKRQYESLIEEQKTNFLDQIQEQIQNFQKVLDEKQAGYQAQISKIQRQMMNEISMLKQSNNLEAMEEKYIMELKKLQVEKEKMEKQLQESKEQAIKEKVEFYEQQLEEQNQNFNDSLNKIEGEFSANITKLNEELLDEKEAHEFTKLERQQKVAYLIQKVGEMKKNIIEKETQIIELQFVIHKKNKELEVIDELVNEKVKIIQKKFNKEKQEMIQTFEQKQKEEQIKHKVELQQKQTQKAELVKTFYQQFLELKEKHYEQMELLNEKYNHLEMLFGQRPSRKEDVHKIKQLTDVQEKMNIQMKVYKKKVIEANDIVKYLNLQLENYKDTYDIFGPNVEPVSPSRKPNAYENSQVKDQFVKGVVMHDEKQEQFEFKRSNTQGDQINSLLKNFTQYKYQEDQESIRKDSNDHQDKSIELKSNASIFMNLIANEKKPVISPIKKKGYGRRQIINLKRKKSISMGKDKTFIIKQYDYKGQNN